MTFSPQPERRGAQSLPPLLGPVLRWSSLFLLVPALDSAYQRRDAPFRSLLVLVVAVLVVAAVQVALPRNAVTERRSPRPPAAGGRDWALLALAAAVFCLAVGASWHQMLALSTPIASDTGSYWKTLPDLIEPTPGFVSARTPFYQLIVAVLDTSGASGRSLLALHVGARAVACAGVAWMLGRRSLWAAVVVGTLLALDPVSATMSIVYLTESLYTTGLMLSVMLVIGQLQRAGTVRPSELLAAGIVFGWTFLFRPAGMALIGPVLVAYAIGRRSLSSAGVVLTGFSLVAVSVALLNLIRSGVFAIAATGPYLAYPLFVQGLLDADNGPASAAMVARLQECRPGWDHRTITASSSNVDIQGKVWPCFEDDLDVKNRGRGVYRPAFGAQFRDAYVEAMVAHPATFVRKMLLEMAHFMSTAVSHYPAAISNFHRRIDVGSLCRREGAYGTLFSDAFAAFFCPTMIEPDPTLRARVPEIGFRTRMAYQPYLYVYDRSVYVRSYRETPHRELAGAAGVLFFCLAAIVVRPAYRPWVVGAALVVLYSAAATAFGQQATRRYAAVTSPFLLLVSGLFAVTVAEDTWSVARAGLLRARMALSRGRGGAEPAEERGTVDRG